MKEYTTEEQKFLLKLARQSIEHAFNNGGKLQLSDADIPSEKLKEKRAAFVTLTQEGNLRGCIGSLEPELPLYQEIIARAFSAAFQDPRFLPLNPEELPKTKISISVLTVPKPLEFQDYQELLNKLTPEKDGVILKKGLRSATYLPKVWEELPNKEQFLPSLCQKAGLESDAWKGNIEVLTYQTIDFSEIVFSPR